MTDPTTVQKTTHDQASPYASPWSLRERIGIMLWSGAWAIFCVWTPKPLNPWRIFVLRCFGAKISGVPFVHSRARIQIPWKLRLAHRACLGDRANAYTLGEITIGEGATIAQEAYLCTGTHDPAPANNADYHRRECFRRRQSHRLARN